MRAPPLFAISLAFASVASAVPIGAQYQQQDGATAFQRREPGGGGSPSPPKNRQNNSSPHDHHHNKSPEYSRSTGETTSFTDRYGNTVVGGIHFRNAVINEPVSIGRTAFNFIGGTSDSTHWQSRPNASHQASDGNTHSKDANHDARRPNNDNSGQGGDSRASLPKFVQRGQPLIQLGKMSISGGINLGSATFSPGSSFNDGTTHINGELVNPELVEQAVSGLSIDGQSNRKKAARSSKKGCSSSGESC